jgi:hypothetical protein
VRDVHEQVGQYAVVFAHNVVILHVLAELNQVGLAGFDVVSTLDLINNIEDFNDFLIAILVNVGKQAPHFTVGELYFRFFLELRLGSCH